MKSSPLLVNSLFELNSFTYRAVFDGCEYAWQALVHLPQYLRSLPLGAIQCVCPEGVFLDHPELISIGEGTVIEPGAYIRGPCVIGRDCQIRHGAYIRGDVLIGDRCVIGHTTEVKHAILLNHAKAAHFAFVGDSILGNDVNLGAGAKCANLRLDGMQVVVRYENMSYPTGLRKFGAIVGDGCQIGCNVVLNPGTIFGRGARSYPAVTIGGVVDAGSVVRPVGRPTISKA